MRALLCSLVLVAAPLLGSLAELKPGNGYEVKVKMAVTFRYNATSF